MKWFDAERGYGFIAPAGGGNDIFVHVSALERSGLTLNEGQAVVVDVVEGRKGLEATRVRLAWLVPWGASPPATAILTQVGNLATDGPPAALEGGRSKIDVSKCSTAVIFGPLPEGQLKPLPPERPFWLVAERNPS